MEFSFAGAIVSSLCDDDLYMRLSKLGTVERMMIELTSESGRRCIIRAGDESSIRSGFTLHLEVAASAGGLGDRQVRVASGGFSLERCGRWRKGRVGRISGRYRRVERCVGGSRRDGKLCVMGNRIDSPLLSDVRAGFKSCDADVGRCVWTDLSSRRNGWMEVCRCGDVEAWSPGDLEMRRRRVASKRYGANGGVLRV